MAVRVIAAVCLTGLGLLLGLGPRALAPTIEAAIERRADQALSREGLDFAIADADGRSLILNGYAPNADLKTGAYEIARAVAGVRQVENRIKLASLRASDDPSEDRIAAITAWQAETILPAPWVDSDDESQAADVAQHRVDYMPMISKDPTNSVDELTSSTCQELLTELMNSGTIQFEINSSTISASSHKLLAQIAKTLLRCPSESRIEISGHTDNSGQAAYNRRLSQQRAESVVQFLTDKGVSAAKLQAKGYGDAQPIADNATRTGRAKNRRIEFTVNGQRSS